ncbi:phage head-tail connector protein [Bombilactobacillus folatiphilus]|uniref:Phage head-tail connector protein n=1 Tax=Bombilactobacillus folatiphilus TaxID=2923362 RepID=A0ABY4PA30_9LACO|nr:phage head-tail connector protein [Bombilactobacillus folatiphilus]UQS82603.1 phage head-tail connector protein [Bombilactobacillus folatiphilus]
MSEILSRIKRLLFIDNDSSDELLSDIVDMTTQRLQTLTGLAVIDVSLNYIIVEVSIKRFNRLKNEGMSSYSQEGESITFSDNDFAEFSKEINQIADSNSKPSVIKFVNPYAQNK